MMNETNEKTKMGEVSDEFLVHARDIDIEREKDSSSSASSPHQRHRSAQANNNTKNEDQIQTFLKKFNFFT
jgi:hypothetical protein